ncbi:ROK family protein [Actinokineospora diospyrosa]|uniref:Glucokinase n=1 Tax=Actinokineospora diospyrosa TaxID=103728 RepID=A0ABT1I8L7_9PSEU|nr:ROK family protein [Actinokineospora diospyrosa]MCP2268967.1 glucokinase (EC 2.7.1.2) [Actinokineospora diospyrosa]
MTTIGIDVGGTSIRAAAVDPSSGAVLAVARGSTRVPSLDTEICRVVAELRSVVDVSAVGLAVAGFVASDRRTVMFAPHLPWRASAVADRLAGLIGLPVVLEHDANAAGVAESRFGALRGARVGLLVALGTGIGAALVIDGAVYRGAFGVAPELGHLRLVPEGRECPCGKRGCWERYCSGTALAATALEMGAGELSGREVARLAAAGDAVALAAVGEMARWLGEGLALVADVYDPEVVVIGGGVSGSAELFLGDAVRRYEAVMTGAGHRPVARVVGAEMGEEAGMVGAAVLAGGVG